MIYEWLEKCKFILPIRVLPNGDNPAGVQCGLPTGRNLCLQQLQVLWELHCKVFLPLCHLSPTLSLLSFSWAGKQRSTRKYIFPVLKIRIICSFFNAMTRATKEIVAEWITLEDQDDDENDEEEVNDEDGGGQNFGVSEV